VSFSPLKLDFWWAHGLALWAVHALGNIFFFTRYNNKPLSSKKFVYIRNGQKRDPIDIQFFLNLKYAYPLSVIATITIELRGNRIVLIK
jgi:hypothetical protein